MIKEAYHFIHYGPRVQKRRNQMEPVEFRKYVVERQDADGYRKLRLSLIEDLEGDILEIGAGTGATFRYYGHKAKVTATEPHDELRVAARGEAENASATVEVFQGEGENISFEDAAFDVVVASMVLCSVRFPAKVLGELKRVLRPGGQIRLLEHVRSEHWLAGPMMDVLNPAWLRINRLGCNCNRRTVDEVKAAGFVICSVESYKIFSEVTPPTFPLRIIKGKLPDRSVR
jgi:SAM-dependent methyltransferase